MQPYVEAAALVLAVNLLPAFAPPTWAVLALVVLTRDTAPLPTIAIGVVAASAGRTVLALVTRSLRGRLSARRRAGYDALRGLLERRRRNTLAALLAFLLSPVPSGQLFVAAGLLRAPLRPLVLAFAAGRAVSYSIYVTAADLARPRLEELVRDPFGSPLAIALNAALAVGVIALARIDWIALLERRGVLAPPEQPT